MTRCWVAVALALCACGGAGAGAGTGTAAGARAGESGPRDVAAIHKANCGKCHARVEPGTRTRAQLEAAFPRHRKRVRMTEEEWGLMVDYLASDKDKK